MPMTYSTEQRAQAIAKVIEGLSNGTPLTVLCRAKGMPADNTVRMWSHQDPELADAIACARDAGFDAIAIEALEILDAEPERVVTMTGEDRSESRIDSASVQRAKNRFDGRLKLLAKWDPKRYGDKTLLGSDPDNPLPTNVTVTFVKPGDPAADV